MSIIVTWIIADLWLRKEEKLMQHLLQKNIQFYATENINTK